MTKITLTPVEGALQVASYGIRVFPVWAAPDGTCACSDGKRCTSPGKHPIQRSWQQVATTDEGQINAWGRRFANCNWGMRTDDLICSDIDPRAGGTREAVQDKLPATAWVVITGGGGWHLGYLPPANGAPKGGNNLMGPGLDVKAKGGFVVCVGSIHASGEGYRWETEPGPDADGIAPWPVLELEAPSANGQTQSTTGGLGGTPTSGAGLAALLSSPPVGDNSGRNAWLTKVAGHYLRGLHFRDGAIASVRIANSSLSDPLDDIEVNKVIDSIGGADELAKQEHHDFLVAKALERLRVTEEAKQLLNAEGWREPDASSPGSEWLLQAYEEEQWSIVDLLSYGGNALLAGQFKAGKSMLLLNLMQAMCDGQPFLGRFPVLLEEGTRVGYFNYELPPSQIQRWTRALAIQSPERFVMTHLRGYNVRLGTPEGDLWAIEWLKRWNVSVWIIDPYAMAFSGDSENDNTQVAKFTASIDQVKEQAGVDIALLGSHFGRQQFEEGEEHVRGATRLDDWADARWIMVKRGDDRFFSASGRDVRVEEARLSFSAKTGRLTLLPGNRNHHAIDLMEGAVLRHIRQSIEAYGDQPDRLKREISGRGIKSAIVGKEENIQKAIKSLENKRILRVIVGPANTLWHVPTDWKGIDE